MSRNAPGLVTREKPKKKPYSQLATHFTFLNSVSIQGKTSPVLKQAHVGILPSSLCNSSQGYAGLINNKALCAGAWAGGTDTCQVRREVLPHLPGQNSQARGSAASGVVAELITAAEILTGERVRCKGSVVKGWGSHWKAKKHTLRIWCYWEEDRNR